MKRMIALLCCFVILLLPACQKTPEAMEPGIKDANIVETVEGGFATYDKMKDGTWQCEGHTYLYRLVIKGRMPSASKDSTFVYLSNLENISFTQAWKAAGFSSNMDDYFAVEDAVLVDWD